MSQGISSPDSPGNIPALEAGDLTLCGLEMPYGAVDFAKHCLLSWFAHFLV